MHRQHFTQDPRLPGLAYGFLEEYTHGKRALMQQGEGLGFANWLHLLPEEHLGFFISTNRRDFSLHEAFTRAFLDRYFTASIVPPEPMAGYRERAPRYAGVYQFLSFDPRMVEKVNAEEVVIRANRDGTLSASSTPGRWVETEPLLFCRLDGEGLMAFRADASGRITDLYTDHWPWDYPKRHWYDAKGLRLPLLAASVLVFLASLVIWLAGRLAGGRRTAVSPDRLARIARMAALALSLLNVLFAALLVPILVVDSQGGDVVTLYGMPPWLTSALAIPLVTTALTVAVVIFAIMAWRRGFWSLAGRIQYSILAASAAAFAWSLAYINMLGFHY